MIYFVALMVILQLLLSGLMNCDFFENRVAHLSLSRFIFRAAPHTLPSPRGWGSFFFQAPLGSPHSLASP